MYHGDSGEITFDLDGFLNVSSYRVRNLVFDGLRSVWKDIGCLQGSEATPFGIIWPGDAKTLKVRVFILLFTLS